jgi:hypothetical protein
MIATTKEPETDTTRGEKGIQATYHLFWILLSPRQSRLSSKPLASREQSQPKIEEFIAIAVRMSLYSQTRLSRAKLHELTWQVISGTMDNHTGTSQQVHPRQVIQVLKLFTLRALLR